MELQEARELIAQRIVDMTSNAELKEHGKVYLAPWDDKRIAWEENSLMNWNYWEDQDAFYNIMDKACEGTGYFVELINSVEGHVCKA